jgi:hypothetical protein
MSNLQIRDNTPRILRQQHIHSRNQSHIPTSTTAATVVLRSSLKRSKHLL